MNSNSLKFIGKYLIHIITLLIAVSAIAFILVSHSPVDPVRQYVEAIPNISAEQRENIAEYWGLNDPPLQRFILWGSSILHGDFGTSLIYRRPVIDVIGEKFLNSLALMGVAWVFSGVIGFLLGCVMGVWRNRWPDRIIKTICLVLCSTPTFWLGLVFLLVFSVWLGWFPVGMSVPAGVLSSEVTFAQRVHHIILPALTLSFTSFANIALHTRQKLIDVLESEYVLFAKARGESTWSIVHRHGFRNIMLPAMTLQFASFSELFGGSILAENVFSYPGLGAAASAAGLNSDVPLLLGITIFSALFVFIGNLAANVIYGIVDPQIKEGYING